MCHGCEQSPVDKGDIYLTDLTIRGVPDLHARQETQLNGLLGYGENTGDYRLRCDHGAMVANPTARI